MRNGTEKTFGCCWYFVHQNKNKIENRLRNITGISLVRTVGNIITDISLECAGTPGANLWSWTGCSTCNFVVSHHRWEGLREGSCRRTAILDDWWAESWFHVWAQWWSGLPFQRPVWKVLRNQRQYWNKFCKQKGEENRKSEKCWPFVT